LRGGSWIDNARCVRAAFRDNRAPDDRIDILGFRIACDSVPRSQGRVLRGGSWYDYTRLVRAACRLWVGPDIRIDILGFRIACATETPVFTSIPVTAPRTPASG
jgi:formylglycine-generating enzyme required for sulfatase activity